MKKHIITASIILLAAALVALGVFMPRIIFSYQNDTLLSQVENDQIDKVSFMDYSDNEAYNALRMLAANEFNLISDERDSDMDTRRQLKNEASSFLTLLQSYSDDYSVSYGTAGAGIFYTTTNFYAPEPCLIAINDYSDYNEAILDDVDIIYDSYSGYSVSNTDSSESDNRPAWMIYSKTASDSLSQFFVIDDASGKVVSFDIYWNIDSSPFAALDINKYIYIFTNLFEDYYNLTVLSCQSEIEEAYYDDSNSEEVFDSFYLYYTLTDSDTSDTTVIITILITGNSVAFNEN